MRSTRSSSRITHFVEEMREREGSCLATVATVGRVVSCHDVSVVTTFYIPYSTRVPGTGGYPGNLQNHFQTTKPRGIIS